MTRGFDPRPPLERFTAKVEKTDGCWLWMGYINPKPGKGYGTFYDGKKAVRAHRWAYENFVGPIPEGLQLDHLCRVRHCVNPSHLEPVTARENIRRGENHVAKNARKTHCLHGHEFTEENTYRSSRGRDCRECRTARRTRWLEKKGLA